MVGLRKVACAIERRNRGSPRDVIAQYWRSFLPKFAIRCAGEKLGECNALLALPVELRRLLVGVGEGRQHRVLEVSDEAPDIPGSQRTNKALGINSGGSRTRLTLALIMRRITDLSVVAARP